MKSVRRGVRFAARPNLAVEVRDVSANRSRTQDQLGGDLAVRPPTRDEPENVHFSRRELFRARRLPAGLAQKLLDDVEENLELRFRLKDVVVIAVQGYKAGAGNMARQLAPSLKVN